MIIKNIATSNRGSGVAPGKCWKSMNVQTFLPPPLAVWNFSTPPPSPLGVWNFLTPLFLELRNFFDPHQIFQPPHQGIYERSLMFIIYFHEIALLCESWFLYSDLKNGWFVPLRSFQCQQFFSLKSLPVTSWFSTLRPDSELAIDQRQQIHCPTLTN